MISTNLPLPQLTLEDLAYIEKNYCTFAQVCAGRVEKPDDLRRAILAKQLPLPSYVTQNGTEWVPCDYLDLLDDAGDMKNLPDFFAHSYRVGAHNMGIAVTESDIADVWQGYLTGEFGICLRNVTPKNVLRKSYYMDKINGLLDAPEPASPKWCYKLHIWVKRLDLIEREFAPCDRLRFGRPTSRDRLITATRKDFPQAFQDFGSFRESDIA